MSTVMDDDANWKVPEPQPEALDALTATRVRLLRAGIARRILAGPFGGSKRSMDTRVRIAKDRAIELVRELCSTVTRGGGKRTTVFDEIQWDGWYKAADQAGEEVLAALKAGDDLGGFLFPSEVAS